MSKNDPPVVLAKVDANEDVNKELASKYEVKGFPTLKIFRNGGDIIQEYKGPREADGIIEYLKKQAGPASAVIKSSEDASNLIVDKIFIVRHPVILFHFLFCISAILAVSQTGYHLIGWYISRIFWGRI